MYISFYKPILVNDKTVVNVPNQKTFSRRNFQRFASLSRLDLIVLKRLNTTNNFKKNNIIIYSLNFQQFQFQCIVYKQYQVFFYIQLNEEYYYKYFVAIFIKQNVGRYGNLRVLFVELESLQQGSAAVTVGKSVFV